MHDYVCMSLHVIMSVDVTLCVYVIVSISNIHDCVCL